MTPGVKAIRYCLTIRPVSVWYSTNAGIMGKRREALLAAAPFGGLHWGTKCTEEIRIKTLAFWELYKQTISLKSKLFQHAEKKEKEGEKASSLK